MIPWSAEAERKIRRLILLDWIGFWFSLLAGIVIGVWRGFLLGSMMTVPAILLGVDLIHQQGKLGEILVNKPRSTEGLTEWVQLRPYQVEISCACGRQVRIEQAKWRANSIDRGGGRFAIVCRCGIGYFKLKQ
jgi:hypothetical protein